MTTSGVSSFSMNASQIISRAFKILGKGDEGEALTASMYADGLENLNLLIKRIGAADHLWVRTEGTLTLIADQATYAITPRALRITSVRRRYANDDIAMTEWSRQEYFDIPNKTSGSSTPVNYYYDPQVTAGTLYVWPAPSAATVALPTTLTFTYLRRIQDMVASNDDLDMPQEWSSAITWGLADDLETQYPVNDARLAQKVERKAITYLTAAKAWDNETASVFLQPDYQGYGDYR